jgi:hypothetical protein
VVRLVAPFQFALLTRDDLIHHVGRQAQRCHHVLTEDPDATGRDCANGELRMSRGAKLSYEEHVEWDAKRVRDFEGHRDPAARKREDDDVVAIAKAS